MGRMRASFHSWGLIHSCHTQLKCSRDTPCISISGIRRTPFLPLDLFPLTEINASDYNTSSSDGDRSKSSWRGSCGVSSSTSWDTLLEMLNIGVKMLLPAIQCFLKAAPHSSPRSARLHSALSLFSLLSWSQSFMAFIIALATPFLCATYSLKLQSVLLPEFSQCLKCLLRSAVSSSCTSQFCWNQSGCFLLSHSRTSCAASFISSLMTSHMSGPLRSSSHLPFIN